MARTEEQKRKRREYEKARKASDLAYREKRRLMSERYRLREKSNPDLMAKRLGYTRKFNELYREELAAKQRDRKASFSADELAAFQERDRLRQLAKKSTPAGRARDRHNHRKNYLMSKYGLTYEAWEAMRAAQNDKCAVCSSDFTFVESHGPKAFKERSCSVDHDHGTGMVRSLLCSKCNSGLGYAKDDAGRLRTLAAWLSRDISGMPRFTRYGFRKGMPKFEELVRSAGGLCGVCGVPVEEKGIGKGGRITDNMMVVDHDHASGRVRGLLCNGCNVAIGKFGEDVAAIMSAANYLDMWSARRAAFVAAREATIKELL